MSPPLELDRHHWELVVTGTVQGVGFRPFVFNLACSSGLVGTVHNDSHGVIIHVQGPEDKLSNFAKLLRSNAPPASRVERVITRSLPLTDFASFRILPSQSLDDAFTDVPPDLALCADCRRELTDPSNRRFGYAFNNCTHCGPRFTIIRGVPYDRPLTTMSPFVMCPQCASEYENPADRRFHAQPVACPNCGPELRILQTTPDGWAQQHDTDAITAAANMLRQRKIVLIQGIGGFHLACDARDDEIVGTLRLRKHRDEKPLAVMFSNVEHLRESCEVSEMELELLASPCAPIVLLPKRRGGSVAESVAPGNPCLGAMLPYSPLHVLLLERCGAPLVMTSANISDDPICYEIEEALDRMHGIADAALVHDRAIHMFADDSVVKMIGGQARVWRRSRGYVPQSVRVNVPFRVPTLAFGPQLKSTFCLGKRHSALISQHLGDTDSVRAVEAYEAALDHFLKLYDAKIELAACDLHPDYATTRIAEEWCRERGVPVVRVQHHHAHLASCLAENGRVEPAIGLTLDGTGWGSDGTIWGGEVLLGDARGFVRAAHLLDVPLLGGEQAATEPWRMALAWLFEAFGEHMWSLPLSLMTELRTTIGEAKLRALLAPGLRKRVFVRTSSLGRLFDAVAALLFFGVRRQHEGQAAMLLEGMIATAPQTPYPFDLVQENGGWIMSPLPMLHALASDLQSGTAREVIARRFHEGLVNVLVEMCEELRRSAGLSLVALSGGCFQNAFLLTEMENRLAAKRFDVLSHRDVPTGDGGVSLGQAVIANAQGE